MPALIVNSAGCTFEPVFSRLARREVPQKQPGFQRVLHSEMEAGEFILEPFGNLVRVSSSEGPKNENHKFNH